MIEYKMTLKQERRIQPIVVFLLHKERTIPAIICTLLSLSFMGFGLAFSIDLFKWGIFFFFPASYFCYFWIEKTRRRALALARLYKLSSTKVFTYTLTETNGVIRDYCNETRQSNEHKKSDIGRIFTIKDTIYVIFNSGSVSVYPNTTEINNFFKGKN